MNLLETNNKSNNKIISMNKDKIKHYFFYSKYIDKDNLMFTTDSIYSSSKSLGSKRLIDVILIL